MAKNEIKAGVWENNPIIYQVLGVCSALAVTTGVKTAFVMSVSLTAVLTFSNLIISFLRKKIPNKIRMIVQLTVISTLVILVDQILKAFMYEQSKQLSVFVGLIITNCIVMGRAEAYAMGNSWWPSVKDALGNGLGYSAILILVGVVRELLGKGTILDFQVVPNFLYEAGYTNMGLALLAPSAFFLIALIIWGQKTWMSSSKGGH
jgi:Na+-transporting NADH:ubiquinone oxidoreductase subunit D